MSVKLHLLLAFVLIASGVRSAAAHAPSSSSPETAVLTESASAAPGSADGAPTDKSPTAAELLAQLQAQVGGIAAANRPAADAVDGLTRTLVAGRGRRVPDAALSALAASVTVAVAQGAFDEESVERLAQNLFAAVHAGALTKREAGLLALDVSMVLADAGVDRLAIDAVIADLGAICPAGAEPFEASVARPGQRLVLTPY